MSYDGTRNRFAGRSSPAEAGFNLTAAMLSDSADLTTYAKAIRIYNMSAAAVKIVVTPLHAASDTAVLTFTIGAGEKETFPVAIRRILSAGSTGLAAGLTAGTVEVQLYTE